VPGAHRNKLYQTVIAAYEGHAHSSDALALARLLARVTGARLLVARVVTRVSAADGPWIARERFVHDWTEAEQVLEQLRQEIAPEQDVETRVYSCASVPRGLYELAEAERADLIVLGSSHRGAVGRVLTGSIAGRLIEGAPCAVAVAPRGFSGGKAALTRIGVAFDGSPESRIALRHAIALAEAAGATLRLIAAVEPLVFPAFANVPAGNTYVEIIRARRELLERTVDEAAAGLAGELQPEVRVVEGEAVEAICEVAGDVDVLVAGSRAWGPVRRVLLGSVSSRLLRAAPCPVLVTPKGAESPAAAGPARHAAQE
jgi:nucleotide-binding universal stress UspA family protein